MPGIVLGVLRKNFGMWAALPILVSGWRRGKRLLKENPDLHKTLQEYGEHAVKELPAIAGLFLVVAERLGDRRAAYDKVFKPIIQMDAVYSMPDLYELEELEKLEDPYEAFKEYNVGLFSSEMMKRVYPIDEFVDEGTHFHFNVQRCVQTELARMAGAEELGEMGCDHDCAGYPLIEDRVHAVFRRSQTIAKGGSCCDFHFYKKGHEPPKTFENK
jgi:hypothetical protein